MYKDKDGNIIYDNPKDKTLVELYDYFKKNTISSHLKFMLSGELMSKKDQYKDLTYHDLLLFLIDFISIHYNYESTEDVTVYRDETKNRTGTINLLRLFIFEILYFLGDKNELLASYTYGENKYITKELLRDTFITLSIVQSNFLWYPYELYGIEIDSYNNEGPGNTYTLKFTMNDKYTKINTTFIVNTEEEYYNINYDSVSFNTETSGKVIVDNLPFTSNKATSSNNSILSKMPVRDILYGIRRPKMMIYHTMNTLFEDVMDTMNDTEFNPFNNSNEE